ncbi:MAG TPA: NlpC/P60 family protein [Rhodospirillales bacterium]|nr:NlpC/P60 family protein [Rhodospirillales bacterium]
MTQPPSWAGAYVGIPYRDHGFDRSGCDCWGLVRLVYRARARIELPSYAGDYADETDSEGVAACVEAARASETWRRIDPPPRTFDVAEMFSVLRSRRGWSYPPLHVGVVVGNGWLIHTELATGARLVRADDRALGKRIAGFWRHRSLHART